MKQHQNISTMGGKIIAIALLAPLFGFSQPSTSKAAEGDSAPSQATLAPAISAADMQASPSVQTAPTIVAAPQVPTASGLRLQQFLASVVDNNDEIKVQKLEWLSNERLLKASRGMYEPVLKVSATRESNHMQNTAQEYLQTYSQHYEFSEANNIWSSSIEGLTPFGSTYRLGYDYKKLQNSLQSAMAVPTDEEYVTFLGLTLTQPLLKGSGQEATNANIRISRANADIAYEGYRQASVEAVARAVQLYWQCYGAQEKLAMRQRSATIAEELLQANKSRYEAGKVDYTAVLDAESGLRLRQALVAAAEQTELTSRKNLLSLAGESAMAQVPATIRMEDVPDCSPLSPDYKQVYEKALTSYPQYLSALATVERENFRATYAHNQEKPQLDVKGSYGYNGLGTTVDNSLDRLGSTDFPSWSVGLELTFPLIGDMKSRNEATAARLKKEQAIRRLEMQKIELSNQMDIVAGLVSRVYSQVQNYEKVVAINAELVRIEDTRFKLGKSDTRMLLEREEEYLKVSESLLDSRLAYQYALVNLYALEGSLLTRYGLTLSDKTSATTLTQGM